MAKFCPECGTEIREDAAFCPECGTKTAAEPKPEASQAPPAPVTPPPPPQRPAPPPPISKEVGTGAFFGLMFLFGIPLIGLIACILISFAAKNKNVKHFARAVLIWIIIGAVLSLILLAAGSLLANAVSGAVAEATGAQGGLGELFGSLGELGELKDAMAQYETVSPSGLPNT